MEHQRKLEKVVWEKEPLPGSRTELYEVENVACPSAWLDRSSD